MYFILVIVAVLVLDQGTKLLVQNAMFEGQSVPVINGIFHLTFVKNAGAAFGIFRDKTLFFVVVTLLVITLIIAFYRKVPKEKWLLRIGLGLQVGGALGNLFDRIRLGRVVDFFDFQVWPVFNIADMAIVLGVSILVLELIRTPEKKEA